MNMADSRESESCWSSIKLKKNPGVTRLNIVGLFMIQFSTVLVLTLEVSFTSYLLKSNYDIEGSRVAAVAGNLGFAAGVGVVCSEIFMGYALDLFGRKAITIIGMAIAGASLLSQPLPGTLYGLYVLRILSSVGVLPALYTPFSVDYI